MEATGARPSPSEPGTTPTRSDPREERSVVSTRPFADIELDDDLAWNLVDAAPDGIVLTDGEGRVLLVNHQAERLFGYDRGELLDRPVDELLPERLRQVHRAHRTRYRAEPRTRPMGSDLTLLGRRKDGTEFPVEISLSPLGAGGGLAVVAVVRDIAARVEAESEAKRVRDLLDATRDGIFIFDGDSLRYVYVNRGAVDQVGYSREELLRMTPLHITPHYQEPEFRALLAPLVRGETDSVQFLTVHRRRDGEDVPVEVVVQGEDVAGTGAPRTFVAIVRDIRERLEAENRLRRTEHDLRLLEEHERIARDLHDIVIQQLFASGMTLQSVWSRIRDTEVAQRVAAVVDDLDRTIREIRTVIFGLQASGADPRGLQDEVLEVVTDVQAVLGFEPRVRFDDAVEQIASDIAGDLLATLREALSNVARHAGASGVEVDLAVSGDGVLLRVVDDGCGVPDGPVSGGSGIRNITERAVRRGGRCEVRRRVEGGTALEWWVPAAPPRD